MWQHASVRDHRFVRQERDEREETEQDGCRARNEPLRPLSLRLDASMCAGSVECDLQLPTEHKPGENLQWSGLQVGAEYGLCRDLLFRIANEHPAHRDRWQSGMIPDGCLWHALDLLLRFAVLERV
jgi:hypothetical protein